MGDKNINKLFMVVDFTGVFQCHGLPFALLPLIYTTHWALKPMIDT